MDHPNIDLVRRAYAAFLSGDRSVLEDTFAPDIRWHQSGFDATSGDYVGFDAVLGHLWADDHLEDFGMEVIDMLANDDRVVVIARSTGRVGERWMTNDFVQVIRIEGGRVVEAWVYQWDQRATAEAFPVAA